MLDNVYLIFSILLSASEMLYRFRTQFVFLLNVPNDLL